jgi:hypothetical protein
MKDGFAALKANVGVDFMELVKTMRKDRSIAQKVAYDHFTACSFLLERARNDGNYSALRMANEYLKSLIWDAAYMAQLSLQIFARTVNADDLATALGIDRDIRLEKTFALNYYRNVATEGSSGTLHYILEYDEQDCRAINKVLDKITAFL